MVLPVVVLIPVAAAGILGAAAAAVYFRQPKLVYRWMLRYGLHKAGLTPKHVKISNYAYGYAERGHHRKDAPTLLFIHGFSSGKEQWSRTIENLPKNLHIIALDLPGHGSTTYEPKDVCSLMGQVHKVNQFIKLIGLKDGRFHVIGESMGGAIAGCYAATYPEQVQLVTLVCPAMQTPELSEMSKQMLSGKRSSLLVDTVEGVQNMLDITYYKKVTAPYQILKGLLEYRRPYNEYFTKLFMELMKDNLDSTLENNLPCIKMASQVVWGEEDKIVHVSGVDVLRRGLPTLTRVDLVQKCGHAVDMEKPRAMAALIMAMWKDNGLLTDNYQSKL